MTANLDPRRYELLRRRWRDVNQDLGMLQRDELWHPLSEDEYCGLLLRTLDEIEWVLAGGEDWRPEEEWED